MNDKITFPRLSAMLADRSGRSKRFSEDFLREFFALISETLEGGESVKIKGLGTFRLSRVEPRRSVDVTTGQPMEISGHSKVVFVPAKELAEAVNAPFEAFTAIEISDEADISQLFTQDDISLQDSQYDFPEDTDMPEDPADIEHLEANTSYDKPESSEKSEDAEKYVESTTLGYADDSDSYESVETEETKPIEESDEIEETKSPTETEDIEETETSEDSEESRIQGKEATPRIPENTAETGETIVDSAEDPTEETNTYENEEEYDEDQDDLDPQKFSRNKWEKILLVSLGAALFALVATFCVWYVFATNDFNRVFNRTAVNSQQHPTDGLLVGKETLIPERTETDTAISEDTTKETPAISTEEAEVPTAPSDALVYDTVSTTRYLTTIAKAHYGNYNLWPYIYEENKAILGHPDRIRPGTPVVVPKLSKYGIDPSKKEDVEKAKKMGVEIYARYGKAI